MKAEILLYSRSQYKDYRWIFTPKEMSIKNLDKLNIIYNFFDEHKSIFEDQYPPLLSINMSGYWSLISIAKTNNFDVNGREIFSLQGLCFKREYWRDIKYLLPYIIDDYREILYTYKYIDFNLVDDLENSHKSITFSNILEYKNSSKRLVRLFKHYYGRFDKNKLQSYPIEVVDLLFYILDNRMTPCEFALRDLGVSEQFFYNLKLFNSTNYIEANRAITKSANVNQISNKTSPFEDKSEDVVEDDKINSNLLDKEPYPEEFCQIFIEEYNLETFNIGIPKYIRNIINETTMKAKRYCLVVKNIITNNIIYSREIPESILLEQIDNYDLKNKNVVKLSAEVELIMNTLLKDGWSQMQVTPTPDPWWTFVFKREKR